MALAISAWLIVAARRDICVTRNPGREGSLPRLAGRGLERSLRRAHRATPRRRPCGCRPRCRDRRISPAWQFEEKPQWPRALWRHGRPLSPGRYVWTFLTLSRFGAGGPRHAQAGHAVAG